MTLWVGRSHPRIEDPPLVRGAGSFVGDVALGAAAARFVRSQVAAGVIKSIETPPGALVFTAADLEDVGPIRPLLHRPDYRATNQPVLASGRVTFVGDPIAVVVAETPEAAEDLADQVLVDIEATTAVVELGEALAAEAPWVHPDVPNNTFVDGNLETADVGAALAAAAHVVSVDIRSHRQNAAPLEARGSLASVEPHTGRVTLTTSTQAPHVIRTAVADLLAIPEADLRVVAPDVGGAFGQKMLLAREDVVVVWLARRLNRSVAWVEDRRENLASAFHSRDQHYAARGAFNEDGELTALEVDILCNVGAYSCYPVTSGVEPLMALAEMPGPYAVPEYKVRARAVASNTCPMGPYRGVSRPAITLTLERLFEVAAIELGIDSLELRRRNLVRQFPFTSVSGLVYDEGSYVEAMDAAADVIDLDAFRRRQDDARRQGRYLGVGFSVFSERTGYGTPAFAVRSMDVTPGYETVILTMDPSGYVEARIGASPHGQGLRTSLSQLISDELGVTPEDVRIIHSDTDRSPYGWGTFASRSIVIAGGAVKLASVKLRDKLARIAAEELEASPDDIELNNGRAAVAGTDVGIGLGDLARLAYHQSHRLGADLGPGLRVSATYDPPGTFSNGVHVAEVDVDVETGRVRIERFVVVEDAGRLINPMIVDGQIHGGVAQGIANALLEEIVYDSAGNPLTTSMMDFLPPTASEIPDIEIYHLETLSDFTATKAKGVGEGGTIGAPAAVLNAISDALSPFGVQVFEMPATPERIRDLVRGRIVQ